MSLPLYETEIQPTTPESLEPLAWWLIERGYYPRERLLILTYAAAHRSLHGVVADQTVDREDEPDAYELLEQSFPAVPYGDPAWDGDDTWELGPAIPADAVIVPPTRNIGPIPEPFAPADWSHWEELAASLPPIAGGSPEADECGADIPFLGDRLIGDC